MFKAFLHEMDQQENIQPSSQQHKTNTKRLRSVYKMFRKAKVTLSLIMATKNIQITNHLKQIQVISKDLSFPTAATLVIAAMDWLVPGRCDCWVWGRLPAAPVPVAEEDCWVWGRPDCWVAGRDAREASMETCRVGFLKDSKRARY